MKLSSCARAKAFCSDVEKEERETDSKSSINTSLTLVINFVRAEQTFDSDQEKTECEDLPPVLIKKQVIEMSNSDVENGLI